MWLEASAEKTKGMEGCMYILFEYGAILALTAAAAVFLFAVSAAFMGVAEWFLRTSHRNANTQDRGSRLPSAADDANTHAFLPTMLIGPRNRRGGYLGILHR